MNEEGKEAIKELKHYVSITPHWKLKEYTFSEVDNYIKTTLNYIYKLQKENKELKIDIEARKEEKQLLIEDMNKYFDLYSKLQKENTELKEKIKEYEIGIVKE